MAITLCYALTIIHASIPRPMRNLKALKLLCLEWIISTHDGWKWIYSKYSNDFKMKISRKCRKQLEKWWQFLGKISTCLRLLPHVGIASFLWVEIVLSVYWSVSWGQKWILGKNLNLSSVFLTSSQSSCPHEWAYANEWRSWRLRTS